MPRPKKENGAEPKKRSRNGCWPCKARKVKCGEEKPSCANCTKSGETCDYSIRLNWGGRSRKEGEGALGGVTGPSIEPTAFTFVSAAPRPKSKSNSSPSGGDGQALDPRLRLGPTSNWASGGIGADPSSVSTNNGGLANTMGESPLGALTQDDFRWSSQHSAKRVKTGSGHASASPGAVSHHSPTFAIPPPVEHHSPPSSFSPYPMGSFVTTPATPGSNMPSGSPYTPQPSYSSHDLAEKRRLSVKSLLVDPSEDRHQIYSDWESSGFRSYGYDNGARDLDIPHNDDMSAILPKALACLRTSNAPSEAESSAASGIDAPASVFEPGGYYNEPVAVRIPRLFEPLSTELLGNSMNLLYFHYFINSTARVMIPHDCPENPFRGVLPQMAMRSPPLLHLLLIYSACHRARALGQPEPVHRIAEWMSDVLPGLQQAIAEPQSPGSGAGDSRDPQSMAPLVTAVMLASLEILSPNIFAVQISWRDHLQMARQLIMSRGGLDHLARHADGARDKAIFLVSRWFAYQDVMGALSGGSGAQLLLGAYDDDGGGLWLVNRSEEELYQVDCFFGFSSRCVALLARVAELAWNCDQERLEAERGQIEWTPTDEVRTEAEAIKGQLHISATTLRGCSHSSLYPPSPGGDEVLNEIYATNQAYHWAGVIVLERRVLGRPSDAPEVQDMVARISTCLSRQREGSSADSCSIFPIFVAGCEARTESDRSMFLSRLSEVHRWGLQHAGKACEIMQQTWKTGRSWETIVDGEFLG